MVEEGKSISNSREGITPDSLKRLVSITKQISATTYDTYDSPHMLLSSWPCSLDTRMKQTLCSWLPGLRRGVECVLRRVWESIIPLKRNAGPVDIARD